MNIPQFDYPVCNKFTTTLLKGQMCYQVDVNHLVDKHNSALGLTFLMDYNTERMVERKNNSVSNKVTGLYDMHANDDKTLEAMIYIDTLGKIKNLT